MGRALSSEAHRTRAARHQKVADALADAGDEWSAVCYFYAAYHLVKAALLDDPLFDDWSACQQKNADLLPQDRLTSKHHGRRSSAGREWGVNELVAVLYPSVARRYERLHQASIDVRYGEQLRAPIRTVRSIYYEFKALVDQGALVSA